MNKREFEQKLTDGIKDILADSNEGKLKAVEDFIRTEIMYIPEFSDGKHFELSGESRKKLKKILDGKADSTTVNKLARLPFELIMEGLKDSAEDRIVTDIGIIKKHHRDAYNMYTPKAGNITVPATIKVKLDLNDKVEVN